LTPEGRTARRFKGKHALVTGAGSGFGRAVACGFARDGATAVLLVERLPERLDAVAAEIDELGARAVKLPADLTDAVSCDTVVEQALAECGRIDVLVSNHAVLEQPTPFLELEDEDWELQLRVNLTSSFVLAQRTARAMAASGGGVILFTASVNALGAGRDAAAYCASKAGLVSLAQVMAVELAPLGIRVNCVSPGPADTQRSIDLVGEQAMERYRKSFPAVPLNRLASADDVAEAFLYLASDAAGYVTGQNLVVDGGLTAQVYDLPE
jgi:NAD(P)-dependent dehydrogenase (short-subunit alcohol dehydrogenase family)